MNDNSAVAAELALTMVAAAVALAVSAVSALSVDGTLARVEKNNKWFPLPPPSFPLSLRWSLLLRLQFLTHNS